MIPLEAKVCVVVGVGPGNGASIASRFARAGYQCALLARDVEALARFEQLIPGSQGFPCDVTDAAKVESVFERIAATLGPIDTLVYNAGSGMFGNPEQAELEDLEKAWRVNSLGLFSAAKQVIEPMKAVGHGNIIVMGATAARRGGANFTAFSQAKAAQRSLAASLARHLGPAGVHVSYLVIDGVIDIPRTREMFSDKPDEFFLDPDDIAETVWQLAEQPKSAWTFETELRPFGETW